MAYNFSNYIPRGRALAIACAGAITLAAGAMYYAQNKSKEKESQRSTFKEGGLQGDSRMNSSDVSAAVSSASSPKSGRK